MRSVKNLFEYLFLRSTEDTLVQFFRYVFVGGTAFVADFGSLYLLTEYIGLHYLLSATIAFVIGLAVNYFLSTLWVFQARNVSNPYMEFLFFALIGVVGFLSTSPEYGQS
ncbi:MAG: GtrA family protein [Bacteroidales bacterium]|nr:GtrA family protein [Bacteroidales bacterium]MDE7072338.1 GtrA family protein [Bacteroidales bacterium]